MRAALRRALHYYQDGGPCLVFLWVLVFLSVSYKKVGQATNRGFWIRIPAGGSGLAVLLPGGPHLGLLEEDRPFATLCGIRFYLLESVNRYQARVIDPLFR